MLSRRTTTPSTLHLHHARQRRACLLLTVRDLLEGVLMGRLLSFLQIDRRRLFQRQLVGALVCTQAKANVKLDRWG